MNENKKLEMVQQIYSLPLISLVRRSGQVHGANFPDLKVQASSLLSIKTGGCPENCCYCPQSAHYKTGVAKTEMLDLRTVIESARAAKQAGASRFCMGAAWREVKDGPKFDRVLEFVAAVRSLGLEVCCTLGMLSEHQARELKEAGLDFYNHNIDTSPEFYKTIIQTREFQDRLDTIQSVRKAGLSVCTGGIIGLGESNRDRISFIAELIAMDPLPESVTINALIPMKGTPLEFASTLDPLDLVRVIATVRILSPKSMIRLSAGRSQMTDEAQFLCFLSGANSIFLGEKLLTSSNPEVSKDYKLLGKIGLSLEGFAP